MSSDTSRSAISTPQLGSDYEVFLSFRGQDTRTGFTDYLYNDLVDAGVRAFRDNEELRVGEKISAELLKAIQNSKIFIPVFSKDYASSKWCLLELVEMVECIKVVKGKMILPIFYDVAPSDVRHQTGDYEKAFSEHEKRFDKETTRRWRGALSHVGTLKGLELKNVANGHEGSLVKMVVAKVWGELKKQAMVVSTNLVGIEDHIEKMMKLLDMSARDVRVVGIYGMGGIGKTTIAKVIFNQICDQFTYCCFLPDIRETSERKGDLVNLQNRLISTILKRPNFKIATVDEGINVIRETFCDKKVLIVLDDIDRSEQFDAFAQNHDWFGKESRIIVTTRNKDLLNVPEVDETYEPKVLSDEKSLQLFSKCAFRSDYPPTDYKELSHKVAVAAAGLPLALEIMGSFLSGKRKDVWEGTLKKLESIPDGKVLEKLKISYDALDYEQKQIFLDIACLFVGEDKRIVFHMWDDCGFYPEHGIEVLVLMSLVKIGDNHELMMHDQLKYLGKEIVRKENLSERGERSRLWSHEDASFVLEEHQGTRKVEALCLDYKLKFQKLLTNEEFAQLPNLRYLKVYGVDLKGDFKHLFSRLRWLSWRANLKGIGVINFHLNNLVVLDLSWSNVTNNWEGWKQIKVANKLKALNLSQNRKLRRTPNLSAFINLEILNLGGCPSLVAIDPSVWDLKNLRMLNIAHTSIQELAYIQKLKKLEELDASGCVSLEGEVDISMLRCLEVVKLVETKISSVSKSLSHLSQLKDLDLGGCMELQFLPLELPSSLVSLRATCRFMKTCPDLSELVELRDIHLSDCHELLEFPREIGNLHLHNITFQDCKKLRKMSTFPSSLLRLNVRDCDSIEILVLPKLENLLEMWLLECPKLFSIRGLKKLISLERLNIRDCEKLPKLVGLGRMESLRVLSVIRCNSVERFPNFLNLKQLQTINVSECAKLTEIRGLGSLELLEIFSVRRCPSLKSSVHLSILENLDKLKKFRGYYCETADKVPDLEVFKAIENVDGPCTIGLNWSCDSSETKLGSDFGFSMVLSFSVVRDEPIMDSIVCPDDAKYPQLNYTCGTLSGVYNFDYVVIEDGGFRSLAYHSSGCSFLLTCGGKHSGTSVMDYLSLLPDLYNAIGSAKESSFTMKIWRSSLTSPLHSVNNSGDKQVGEELDLASTDSNTTVVQDNTPLFSGLPPDVVGDGIRPEEEGQPPSDAPEAEHLSLELPQPVPPNSLATSIALQLYQFSQVGDGDVEVVRSWDDRVVFEQFVRSNFLGLLAVGELTKRFIACVTAKKKAEERAGHLLSEVETLHELNKMINDTQETVSHNLKAREAEIEELKRSLRSSEDERHSKEVELKAKEAELEESRGTLQIAKEEFKRSDEFRAALASAALEAFDDGFKTCLQAAQRRGLPPALNLELIRTWAACRFRFRVGET